MPIGQDLQGLSVDKEREEHSYPTVPLLFPRVNTGRGGNVVALVPKVCLAAGRRPARVCDPPLNGAIGHVGSVAHKNRPDPRAEDRDECVSPLRKANSPTRRRPFCWIAAYRSV